MEPYPQGLQENEGDPVQTWEQTCMSELQVKGKIYVDRGKDNSQEQKRMESNGGGLTRMSLKGLRS